MKRIVTVAASLLLSVSSLYAANTSPLRLLKTTPLPAVTGGDFDHFAVDRKNNRLYVVSEDYASIELFDPRTGEHLQSVLGVVKSPRKIALIEDKGELMVNDAGTSSCEFLDAKDLHLIASVPLEPGPDAGAYDPVKRIFYVGNGGKAAHAESAYVSMISVDKRAVVGRIEVPATTLKTVVLDAKNDRLYVTMRDKNQIAVIDLKQRKMERIFSNPELHVDSAMALDAVHHRLFVGDRKPGKLVVLNTDDGSTVATLPLGDTSDDMTYDPVQGRLYSSSAEGVDVIGQDSPNSYHELQHVDTKGGKVSIYVPWLKRYFVAHTKDERSPVAELLIYEVR
jgi:DNA-binding beta-propeller fold protein YncE